MMENRLGQSGQPLNMSNNSRRILRSNNFMIIASDANNLGKVERLIDGIVEDYQIPSSLYGNILISVTEAVTNAITHGNSKDLSKDVRINYKVDKGKLSFRIADEGYGFDYENIPDPTAPENILNLGGRGIFLMKQLSDGVEFENNGSVVEIFFNI